MKLTGFVFILSLVLSGLPIWLLMTIISFPLLFVSNITIIQRKHQILKFLIGIFLDFNAFILKFLGLTNIYIYSDDPAVLTYENIGLIMSNHRTRIDWIYMGWVLGQITNSNSNIIFILKESLKSVPIFGWAMQFIPYIFLSR